MFELYFFGAIAAVILFLWGLVKFYKAKARKIKQKAVNAKHELNHDRSVNSIRHGREAMQPSRVKERVDEAEADGFSDFYNGDS